MKLLMLLLPIFACFSLMVKAQETTVLPTEAPEITMEPETTTVDELTSTAITETSELTTTALPDSTASSTMEELTTTDPSTMTSETPVETTTAINETTNGNSTDCKDSVPAVCKSFVRLCQPQKGCKGKKGGSKETDQKDKMNKEKPKKPVQPKNMMENDENDDEAICAWARMQPHPQLLQVVAKCDQENISTPLQFIKGGLIGGPRGPRPPMKPKGNKKQLDCRIREITSVFFRLLCPATCDVC